MKQHMPSALSHLLLKSMDQSVTVGTATISVVAIISTDFAHILGDLRQITIGARMSPTAFANLNGHSLAMSKYFYHQQRLFTTIELSTANFGGNPTVASNVEIKNGIIDLTSHHGIHGNYTQNIRFGQTHCIQLNQFDNVVLTNIEVGPTSSKVLF